MYSSRLCAPCEDDSVAMRQWRLAARPLGRLSPSHFLLLQSCAWACLRSSKQWVLRSEPVQACVADISRRTFAVQHCYISLSAFGGLVLPMEGRHKAADLSLQCSPCVHNPVCFWGQMVLAHSRHGQLITKAE